MFKEILVSYYISANKYGKNKILLLLMIDYNFFYIKIFTNNIINNYVVSIFCNNFNYELNLHKQTSYNTSLVFNDIIVHKNTKYIYLQFTNIHTSQITIFYLNNYDNIYKLHLSNSDIVFIKVRTKINVNLNLLEFDKLHNIDHNNLYIYHRKLTTLIPEIKNNNINWYIDFLSYSGSTSILIRKIFTKLIGYYLKSFLSKHLIKDFIKFYNINMNNYIDTNYNSFNDFFTRKLVHNPYNRKFALDYTKKNAILEDFDLISPTSGRLIAFNNIDQSQFTTWIKGTEFNIKTLINETLSVSVKSLVICRLAPQDYHHFHMPYMGILVNISEQGLDYYSVQPKLINSSINVLTENYRKIYKFKSKTNNNDDFFFWIVAIGALCVGSIEDNNLKIGSLYNKGDLLGNFSLGGSTVVFLSSVKFNISDDITYYSNNNIETYLQIGDTIGSLNNLEPLYYPKHYSIKQYDKPENKSNLSRNILTVIVVILFIKLLLSNKN